MYCLILFRLSFFPLHVSVCAFFQLSISIPLLLSLALFRFYMLFSPFLSLPPSLSPPLPCESQTPLLTFPVVSKQTDQKRSKPTMLFFTCFQTAQNIVGPLSILAKLPVSPSLLETGCEGQKYVQKFQRSTKVTLPNLPSICVEEQDVAHYPLCLPVSILNTGLTPVTLLS